MKHQDSLNILTTIYNLDWLIQSEYAHKLTEEEKNNIYMAINSLNSFIEREC